LTESEKIDSGLKTKTSSSLRNQLASNFYSVSDPVPISDMLLVHLMYTIHQCLNNKLVNQKT